MTGRKQDPYSRISRQVCRKPRRSRGAIAPAGWDEFSRRCDLAGGARPPGVGWDDEDDRTVGKRRTEGRMAIDLSLFNSSVTTLLDHLTQYHGDDAELETYVICARVKSPDIPGGSGLNWIVNPGGEKLAGGLLREVLKAVEGNGGNGNRHGPPS